VPLVTRTLGNANAVVSLRLSAFVDLPSNLRGIHASRSYESISEAFSELARPSKAVKIEDLCAKVALELLRRHEYARSSEVRADGEIVVERKAPRTGLVTFEPYRVLGRATASVQSGGSVTVRRYVGVEVVGLSACPCAKALVEESSPELASAGSRSLSGTHTQRCVARVVIEVPEGYGIDALKLAEIVESSFSSPTYGLLKREDELAVVSSALSRPKLAEDIVRAIAEGVVKAFPELPDDTRVLIYQRSFESVHKHDMVAVKRATLGALRAELGWSSRCGGLAT
jgi:GTP cyclohydrolase-4